MQHLKDVMCGNMQMNIHSYRNIYKSCNIYLTPQGIVRGNDPYLYGDKLKAYLIKGAKWLPGQTGVDTQAGWGALCLRDSLPF
ncbi:MAG: hypothetical protein OSJ45_00770 [Lachnospiraceae bacterium]|nr:hypothetical protein [Lachnospiraceae bacterium]